MNGSNIKSPGVYINETNAFPNSIIPVATAVPAFIGYTPQASYQGKSYTNVAVKITSFAEFAAFYCYQDPPPPAPPAKQYKPQYYLVQQKSQPVNNEWMMIDGAYYSIVPDSNTIYYLYNSVRLFYENGGGAAYIVSVGSYGDESKNPMIPGDNIVNPNVQLNDLLNGLVLLNDEQEPTMYICPEASLLTIADNGTMMQAMLLQCSRLQRAICIFDIIGGRDPDPLLYTNDIETFRNQTGSTGLSYGTAYYPFIGTTIVQANDIDYDNFFGEDIDQLAAIISPAGNPEPAVAAIIADIKNPESQLTSVQKNNALQIASKRYNDIVKKVLTSINILPVSGAMAGVITTNDSVRGVWHAAANTGITGTVSLPINLTDNQQGNLNADAVSGKSINAIRLFTGTGILVWGARTLDGNSMDWKYIPVRRTLIFLEQSCMLAARAYTFEANDKKTWEAVKSMISNFLMNVWKQGGLQGAKPEEAFSISCGLGTTMTAADILNGVMNISIMVAVTHPAEFIVITIQQQQAVPG